jgi:hypothetical protein
MIFVDLDDCLVCFHYGSNTVQVLRPGALVFLAGLRAIDKVKLFTTGIRSHALDSNKDCNLGFAPEDIIAREDFCQVDRYAQKLILHATLPSPGCVFIDNQTPDDSYTNGKLEYLGVGEDRMIVVPHFGWDEPAEKFPNLIPSLLKRTREMLGIA